MFLNKVGSEESVSYNGDTYYLFDNGELNI